MGKWVGLRASASLALAGTHEGKGSHGHFTMMEETSPMNMLKPKLVAAVIFENPKGEILLYLRDNKPNIPFPHHWDLFGGHIEFGETPEEALRREVREELNYDLKDSVFFKKYECRDGDAYPNDKYIYTAIIDKPLEELTLLEGEKLAFFSKDKVLNLKFANILKEIVLDYLESRGFNSTE